MSIGKTIRFWGAAGLALACAALGPTSAFANGAGPREGKVDFRLLGNFEYMPNPPSETGRVRNADPEFLSGIVPSEVLQYNGSNVEISGYMLAIKTNGKMVSEFLLLPDTTACCYGVAPAYNGYVYVRLNGPGAYLLENVPITIFGRLEIEEVWENGFFSHLYAMQTDGVTIGRQATAPELNL